MAMTNEERAAFEKLKTDWSAVSDGGSAVPAGFAGRFAAELEGEANFARQSAIREARLTAYLGRTPNLTEQLAAGRAGL